MACEKSVKNSVAASESDCLTCYIIIWTLLYMRLTILPVLLSKLQMNPVPGTSPRTPGWQDTQSILHSIMQCTLDLLFALFSKQNWKKLGWTGAVKINTSETCGGLQRMEGCSGQTRDPLRGNQISLLSKKPQHPVCLISMTKFSDVW